MWRSCSWQTLGISWFEVAGFGSFEFYNNCSQITAIPLSSGSKEWTLGAGDDGEIVCVACSEKLVCFAMTNYLVRVCSVYGTQKGVLLAPGPVISMSASGYHLLIAYHSAAPRKGDQCVSTMLVKLEGKSKT